MAKRYLTLAADGGLSITEIAGDDADGSKLTKTLFEISRTSDMTTHFDPAVHTREAIADTDVRSLDRYFRDAWEWSD